jgi:hypothetical protein
MRCAIVRGARDRAQFEAFMPGNYRVTGKANCARSWWLSSRAATTLAGRCTANVSRGSRGGLLFAEEIDLSHAVVGMVPA